METHKHHITVAFQHVPALRRAPTPGAKSNDVANDFINVRLWPLAFNNNNCDVDAASSQSLRIPESLKTVTSARCSILLVARPREDTTAGDAVSSDAPTLLDGIVYMRRGPFGGLFRARRSLNEQLLLMNGHARSSDTNNAQHAKSMTNDDVAPLVTIDYADRFLNDQLPLLHRRHGVWRAWQRLVAADRKMRERHTGGHWAWMDRLRQFRPWSRRNG